MSKGSNVRPRFVSVDEWARNFDRIFNHDELGEEPEQVGQEPVVEGDEPAETG